MTRRKRFVLISAGGLLLLLLIAAGVAVVMVQSGWLREKIREQVISAAEKATGGKVEIGALNVDWKTLTATLDNLVIHGTEPAGAAPLLAIKRVLVGFKIISFMARDFNVALVQADSPRVHLIVEPDGSTNLPEPKTPRSSKPATETILALKIGKFDLGDGQVAIERIGSEKDIKPWNAHGANLMAHVTYNRAGPRYDGTISIAPFDLAWNGTGKSGIQIAADINATASMEKNRLKVSAATIRSAQSEIDLTDVVVDNFTKPVTTAEYSARLSLVEADQFFHLVNFRHTGTLSVEGKLRFASATDYLVTGAVKGSGIGYGKVPDIRIAGNVTATPDDLELKAFLVNAVGGRASVDGYVRKLDDFHIAGRLEHFDARDLAAVGGLAALPYDGLVSGPFDATGKLQEQNLHNLKAGAMLAIVPAGKGVPVRGELVAQYSGATSTVALGRSWLELPSSRVDLTGTLGQRLDIQAQTHDLNDLAPVLNPNLIPAKLAPVNGSVTFNGSVTGPIADPRIAGHASVLNAVWEGQTIDSLTGDFTAMKTLATVTNAAVVSNNLRGRVTGSVALTNWKPIDSSTVAANVQVTNADIAKLLAIAGQKDIPATGTLNTTAQISGTVGDPHATADITLSRGQLYGEPYDSIAGRAQYLNGGAQTLTVGVSAGRKRINATARLDRPDKITFNVSSNAMALSEIALARKYQPQLQGSGQVKADGVVRFANKKLDILDLNADLSATGLLLEGRDLGDAHIIAATKSGVVTARLDSNIAKSTIHGEGTLGLTTDYPVNAKITFSGLGLSAVAAAMKSPSGKGLNLDGSAEGEVTFRGPANQPDQLTASLDIAQLELHPLAVTGDARRIPNLSLRNTGPLRATLARSVVRVESAHFQAPSTDFTVGGSVALKSQSPLDLRMQGNVNLALAQTFNEELSSSGELLINATMRGSFTSPDFSGRAELQKGDFHYADFSNGLTNTNGVIVFSGTRANIQTMAAESGGGKVDASGFAALTGGQLTFRVEARTQGVRVRYPEGVSSISDSDLTLAGSSERSQASGTVTVRRVAINPKSDLSTILAGAAQPMKTPEASDTTLSNMNLDIQIETAPDVAFETSVAQSIQADANLRLRGTAANPAVIGRVNITQGELNFLGNKYTVNQGSVSFFNPAKIDPILNIDLETKARGVDIIITVTGPLNGLKASYRSDPPLQFSDIVALLATGRTPTDPTLAVRNTGQSQSLQQLTTSALIGQAIANPVAGRLQRFFGVSKIKIDPQLTGITGSPEARLTIEQQISPDLLFTYITDVSSTSTQLIRVEWDFNRRWSAILTREENGYVGVDFAFKKRFK